MPQHCRWTYYIVRIGSSPLVRGKIYIYIIYIWRYNYYTWVSDKEWKYYPPQELTYPSPRQFWRWRFLFPRWDMLIPWRVHSTNLSNVWNHTTYTVWIQKWPAKPLMTSAAVADRTWQRNLTIANVRVCAGREGRLHGHRKKGSYGINIVCMVYHMESNYIIIILIRSE